MSSAFYLFPDMFTEKERILLTNPSFKASTFRYPSGVCAVRMENSAGHLIMLPFQGQQIWSAEFGGRELTMKSMFIQPLPTRQYLDTYGAFLLHCGFTAMGVPSAGDNHPLHGELPNAPYSEASLILDEDEQGSYLALGGKYQHTVAFSYNYLAEPFVKLYADSSLFRISMTITNLKNTEMEYMYLAHINYRPVDEGRLVYSAVCSPATVRVRTSIPSHVRPKPGYREFLDMLKLHPEQHHVLKPGLMFDPEVVFFVNYRSDKEGWAHTMQVHPDGSADYVSHRPEQLDHGIRWICRTADQDALGMIEPATAEPEGYTAEKAKGNVKALPAKRKYVCEILAGALSPEEARKMEAKIAALIA